MSRYEHQQAHWLSGSIEEIKQRKMDLVRSYITSVFTRRMTAARNLRLVDMAQARTENIGHHMSQFETQSLRPESVKLVRHTIKEQVTHAHSRSALFSELSEHHQVRTLYLGL